MKNKLKKKIVNILIINLALLLVVSFIAPKVFDSSTVQAIGDLSVDWGVPAGSPIFTISNFAPGQSQSHIVSVKNNATTTRPVGVRGVKTSETGSISNVLNITISQNGSDLYGGTAGTKTLSQFFTESSNLNGIPLSLLPPSASTNYVFKVEFNQSAGNEFQGKSITFDLKIGISVDIPTACLGIHFAGDPIFGTQGNDTIHGTNGNDLIFGFEGNDQIDGGNGNDCIVVLDGNTKIKGGNGNDIIIAGNGNNKIDGGNGDDQITVGNGKNIVEGSNGDDIVTTGNGNNDVSGGNGIDRITTGNGNDNIRGDNGNDILIGGPGNDIINGGLGIDTCTGGEIVTNCEF